MTDELPLYICHKRVRAAEILAVVPIARDGLVRVIASGYPDAFVPEAAFVRYKPFPGDFLVVYEDGYQSFSPRKAFVDGYSLAQSDNVLMERLNDLADTAKTLPPEKVPEWMRGHDFWAQASRVAREAYVTINSLKFQLENLQREKAGSNPDQA